MGKMHLYSNKSAVVLPNHLLVNQPQLIALSDGRSLVRSVFVEATGRKLKTRRAAYKRLKLTGSGLPMKRRPGKQHLNQKKSTSRKKSLSNYSVVAECDRKQVARCLPYA